MENNNNNPQNLPDVNLEGTAGGKGAVGGQSPQEPSIPLSELNKMLGKDFKDKDTAIKSLKDTQSYTADVGVLKKRLSELEGGSASAATGDIVEVKAQISALQNDLYFERNPKYKSARPIVEKLARAEGKRLDEVVDMPEFKELFTKVEGFDKSQSMRTVLESNPRLASSQDKMSKAQGLAATRSRKSLTEAGELAVGAVMEAYPDFVK